MDMLDLTRAELETLDALTPTLNDLTQAIIDAIPYTNVPASMKAVVAIAQLTTFASQFRRNILLWDGTEVPINAISFIFTASGNGKDSSVNAARKCFVESYKLIQSTIDQLEVDHAIAQAVAAGEDPSAAKAEDIYKKYLRPRAPIDIAPTTGPGLIQHINDISELPLSCPMLYSGEFSDELAFNQDMVENIKILSELFDIGNKEMKYTKGVEHRSKPIKGQAVSALFVGSPGHILYDETTKKKFHVAFMSKLARRSWFCYSPERIPDIDFLDQPDPIRAMIDHRKKLDIGADRIRNEVSAYLVDVTNYQLNKAQQLLGVSSEVYTLFEVYRRYNSELADTMANPDSTTALIRRHLQWKALKLAGAFAITSYSEEIGQSHYVDAIKFCELLDADMALFEQDLNKAPHERFADYMHTLVVSSTGKAVLSAHELKKNNFVSTITPVKLHELIQLAAGYDQSGIYTIITDGGAIQYEPIIKTETIGISYKPIDTTALSKSLDSANTDDLRRAKHAISLTTADGYDVTDTTFADLADLLAGDFAYSPFKFLRGVRGKDFITGGTKWLVLDVDTSPITAQEAHLMLSDINHFIALSSNPNNYFKFRVLIELDTNVVLSPLAWKHFYLAIANDLALQVDPLPQSQIFFSYAGRPVFSVLDAEPLSTRDYIMRARSQEHTKELKNQAVTPSQKQALINDELTTFNYAFDSPWGSASRNVIRAMYHIRDLGGSLAEALALYDHIQEYWEAPFEASRSDALIEQIKRMF